jgi:DNA helicase-2/ATP-dependent DNA helicase PcrA
VWNRDNILALTFTKKAATEMKNRIAALVGERKARRLYMGTFHSIFVRFLREFADRIGYPSSFTIYDQSDAQSAVKACIRQLGLKDDEEYKPKRILSRISWAKNNLVTFSSYLNKPEIQDDDRRAKIPSDRKHLQGIY